MTYYNRIEEAVMYTIGEDVSDPDVFTEDNIHIIRESVNNAIQEISMCTASIRVTNRITLQADRPWYRLHRSENLNTICYIVSAWDNEAKLYLQHQSLSKIFLINPYRLKRRGLPECYCQIGNNVVGIFDVSSSSGRIIDFDCVCVPPDYDATTKDIINAKRIYDHALINYAVSEYAASVGDAAKAKEFFDRYIEGVNFIRSDKSQYGQYQS